MKQREKHSIFMGCFQEFMHHLYLNSVSNERGYFLNYLNRPIEYLRRAVYQGNAD